MTPEYTVIDCKTDLIEGPFESFEQARECAEDFKQWEIINRDGDLVDWSPKKRKGRRRRTCVLYWLFDKTCTDPWKHGYIGISKRRAQRLWRHKRGGQWPKGFKHIILFIGSDDACTTLENIMRPTPRIGWNRAAGGCTSIRFAGVPEPLAQRLLMSKAATLRFAMNPSDELVDLRDFIAKDRAWLQEQLRACESGNFKLFSVEDGRNIDTTPKHIEQLKRLISEHDKMLASHGGKNA
jgi:hypothetical protein